MRTVLLTNVGIVFCIILAVGNLNAQRIAGHRSLSTDAPSLPSSFPTSRYTPFGYIDNPFHSMVLHRSGVLRSVPAVGYGWWKTGMKGAYGSGLTDHVNYFSLLQMAVSMDGTTLAEPSDFLQNHVELASRYHTHHLMTYDWEFHSVDFSFRYFLPRENSLACWVELRNNGPIARAVVLHATHVYSIGDTKWWGSNGLYARRATNGDASVAGLWAYGDVFSLGATTPSFAHKATDSYPCWKSWVQLNDSTSTRSTFVKGRGPQWMVQSYRFILPPKQSTRILVCLSRGVNESEAVREMATAFETAFDSLRAQLAEDETFWSKCPMIEGDWPDSWKHGWVYDYETLRMNIRNPLGIFKHHWDAMQVHSPRVVLGETSIDMMAMSYADPALARDVILGTFEDAIAPNVPCVREDGSVNMVSSDGSECGTAPMWGYPFHVIRAIHQAGTESTWIRTLYPYLKSYLAWWLEHRTDTEGWLHCNNSWESGQDGSRRFLVAEHNEAAVADFVRTVDVEASTAEAMRTMEEISNELGLKDDARSWRQLAERRTQNVNAMFFDGWFRDVDARNSKPIILNNYYDIMMLAPLTCGVTTEEQTAALKTKFAYFHEHLDHGLEWPPAMQTYTEAAANAGEQLIAAEAVAATAERVYARTDARAPFDVDSLELFSYRVPGVANEFWPIRAIPPGGENYGWGATLPMFILRSIVGFRELNDHSFVLCPAFPARLVEQGNTFRVTHLRYRDFEFDLNYVIRKNGETTVQLDAAPHIPVVRSVSKNGQPIDFEVMRGAQRTKVSFTGANGDSFKIVLR